MTLLIVDDNRDAALALVEHAKLKVPNVDISVHIAETLGEGKILTQKIKPSLTFMDCILPDATLFDVADAIKHFYPPVISYSGHEADWVGPGMDKPLGQMMLDAGARFFFTKGSAAYNAFIDKAWLSVLLQDNFSQLEGALKDHGR